MEHQEYQELLALHSLDALEVSEARDLEEHLNTCPECRAEMTELRDAAALLAHAATPAEPRAEVRDRIRARVTAQREPPSASAARVLPLQPRARRNLWAIALRLAAGMAFVALLVGVIVLWRRDVRMRQEIAQLSRQVN